MSVELYEEITKRLLVELAKELKYEVRKCEYGFFVLSPREKMYASASHPHRQYFKTEDMAWEVAGIRAKRLAEGYKARSDRAKQKRASDRSDRG